MALSFFLLTLALSTPGPTPGFASGPEKECASHYEPILNTNLDYDSPIDDGEKIRVEPLSIEEAYEGFFYDGLGTTSYEKIVKATAECKYFLGSANCNPSEVRSNSSFCCRN